MLGRIVGFLVLGCAVPNSWAAGSLTLQFDTGTPREIWIAAEPPTSAPAASTKSEEKVVAVPTDKVNPNDRIYIWDKTTGLLARLPIDPAKSTLQVTPQLFAYAFRTVVRVEHAGKPVAASVVKLVDGERAQSLFLDPGDKGELAFYAVKLGQVKVDVQYKSKEETKSLPTQIFELKPQDGQSVQTLTLVVADDVATIETKTPAESKTPEKATTKPEPKADQASPVGTLVVYLLGLAVIVGGVYYFLKFARDNPKVVEDNLKKLGVPLPDPNSDTGAAVDYPPAPVKPEPIQPIILDAAAPDPTPVITISGVPALVADGGRRFDLGEGTNMVGREDGLAVALPGESTVSRIHAEVVRQGGSLTVQDMQSTNGTFVNGAKVDQPTPIRPGDTVQFGAVRFRVEA